MKTPSIQSVTRAFDILQIVGAHPEGIGVTEIANSSQLHTSTVSRMLTTLERVNAVRRIKSNGKVTIGEGLISIVGSMSWTDHLISIARQFLRELAHETGEAIGLTSIEGGLCHIFFQIESTFNVQVRDWTGERFPIHVTSTGKLYLAELGESELNKFLGKPMQAFAPGTITDPDQMLLEIEKVAEEGVSWTVDELEKGLSSIAAPIRDHAGHFIAGLYLSAPGYRFSGVRERNRIRDLVRAVARDITAELAELRGSLQMA